jgi:probable rRNA maturation factor
VTVHLTWEVEERPVDDEWLVAAVEAALDHGGEAGREVSLALVDDPTLAELHGRFLDDPSPTDVMSFHLGDDDGGPWGEVVVSVDRAREVALARGGDLPRELLLYAVHGTLHLCGFDDLEEPDREAMRRAEAAVLERIGAGPE